MGVVLCKYYLARPMRWAWSPKATQSGSRCSRVRVRTAAGSQRWEVGVLVHLPGEPGMAGAGPVSSVLGLLLVSALFGVLGERPSPDQGAHSGTSEGCWREAWTAWEKRPLP